MRDDPVERTVELRWIITASTVGEVRCAGCHKKLGEFLRPSNARLRFRCPRCKAPGTIDVLLEERPT